MTAQDGDAANGHTIVVTWPGFERVAGGQLELLRASGLTPVLAPKHGPRTAEQVAALLAPASAAIVSTDPVDEQVLQRAPGLRILARVGVGTDSIDLEAATRHGVCVTTTRGANEQTVADHALAMILAAIRRVVEHDASVRRGEWDRGGDLTGGDLHGKTVGLVGFGAIGRAVRERLDGFGTRVLVADPFVTGHEDVAVVSLDELLAVAHVVSLHAPLGDGTRLMIGARELALMREDAILVNTARGGLVDEEALADALEARAIRAAALDVFEEEPPGRSRISSLPSVLLTPHVAGLSIDSIEAMVREATGSVLDVLAGRRPRHLVNPEALDAPAPRTTTSRRATPA